MITIEVETFDLQGNPIDAGCYKQYDPTGGVEMVKKKTGDRYREVLGDGKAWVSVPVVETHGGPGYSSIKVGVEICLHCAQDSEIVREVADMVIADGMEIVDNHIGNAYSILLNHREELNKKLEEGGWNA
tara:strand:+ start:113 stop:502 length:390 start_codon:yes stop_codon:yes gene_type:complete